VFNATFSYIMATSFSGGRSRSPQREPLTMGKQLVNFITCGWKRTTDPGQATGKLYHLRLPIECTLFCNLQSRSRTHAVL